MNTRKFKDTRTSAIEKRVARQFEEARKSVKPYKFVGFQEANMAIQNAKRLLSK